MKTIDELIKIRSLYEDYKNELIKGGNIDNEYYKALGVSFCIGVIDESIRQLEEDSNG